MPRFPGLSSICRAAIVLSLCLATAACVTVKRKTLSDGLLPVSGTLPVEVHIGQQEIMIDSQRTGALAMGGGLLGVLAAGTIDQLAARRDERRASVVRDAMIGADIESRILDAIQQHIDQEPLAQALAHETYRAYPIARVAAGTIESRNPVLAMTVTYSLTHDFSALRVRLATAFGAREIRRKKDRSKYAYIQVFDSITLLPGDQRALSENQRAAMWAAMGQDAIAEMIEAGALETVAMMNWTYATARRPPKQGESVRFEYSASVFGRGKIDRYSEDRRWVRTTRNSLVSIPR